jgi:sugar lactone lactonase YvrE
MMNQTYRGVLLACWAAFWPAPHRLGAETATPVRATHKEVESIGVSGAGRIGQLTTLCVTAEDKLLACDALAKEVKVFDVSGRYQGAWKLTFAPQAICTGPEGVLFVGGTAKLAKLDAAGKLLKTADVPQEVIGSPAPSGAGARFGRFRGRGRPAGKASGMAVLGKELFVSFGSGWSLRAKAVVVRFDLDLGSPKTIATGMLGCCQRLDMTARGDVLYVAENTRYRVVKMDREGRTLASWGRRDRKDVRGFGSCCNPMNICFGAGGVLYTSESGLGRVKRYTADGEFLSLVGEVGVTRFTRAGGLAASCSNIAVAVSRDGGRVFVQDVKTNGVRVLAKKG